MSDPTIPHPGSIVLHALAAGREGERQGLEYALAAILDCHTRIVAKHVPSPRVRRVRAGYRDRSLRAALAHRSERR